MYGLELVLYFKIVRAALVHRRTWERRDIVCVLFSTVGFLLATIWVTMCAVFGEEMWLIHSGYPGGATAFWLKNEKVWYMNVGRAAVPLLQLMTDGLLIHRCWALYNNACIIVPCIMWFAALGEHSSLGPCRALARIHPMLNQALGISVNWALDS
ncbi:hypothetical protein J3R83DRAFT_5395 [Lanmaoa asiatica]|nr:hypothetical protein J3R83DRAFT_5395 [Lanmaoa asiatica]